MLLRPVPQKFNTFNTFNTFAKFAKFAVLPFPGTLPSLSPRLTIQSAHFPNPTAHSWQARPQHPPLPAHRERGVGG